MDTAFEPVIPSEGLHVLHLFYRIEHGAWRDLGREDQLAARTDFASIIQEIRATPDVQIVTLGMVTPKSDLGIMLAGPDLQVLHGFEKRLALSLGPDILTPVYSYLSMTERSEYTTSDEEYAAELRGEKGLAPDSPGFAAALEEFRGRMAKYSKHRLYPGLPDWPVLCFYPMSKRRAPGQNWYALDFETRRELMKGHAAVGRRWAGKIIQLITGSAGLDDHEWFVTLFAHNTEEVKKIIYEMRFDPVSAEYAEFGEFLIGLQLPVHVLFSRLQL